MTFSGLIRPSELDSFPFFQGDMVISVAMARFLRPFSQHGGSLSSSASGADYPLAGVRCGGTMKVIAFLMEYVSVDRIINHLKMTFVADKPPPPMELIRKS